MYHSTSLARTSSQDSASRACDVVIALVAREKNVPAPLLKHKSRCRAAAAHARQLAMYLAHTTLGSSLAEVALAFGRDRTTVSYACAQIEDRRDDPCFDAELAALEAKVESLVGAGQ